MREITTQQITAAVRELCMTANCELGEDVRSALATALETEESLLGRDVLAQLLENAEIAAYERVPICQDTGVAVVFVEVGQEACVVGGCLYDAIDEGVRQGYRDGYLRKSMLRHPLIRENTGDNTPAIVHVEVCLGDKVKLTVAPKGGGSENMSGLCMLPPSSGVEGVKRFVVDCVRRAGSNPCPPVIVGVGIGGNFERVAFLSKKALLRDVGAPSADPLIADLEKELLILINDLGIGPSGLGGRTTALAVHIESFPCHITALPVAVNIQCHAARHGSRAL